MKKYFLLILLFFNAVLFTVEPYQILKVPQNATDLEILGFPKGTLSDQVDEKQIRFAYQNLYLLWRPENALPRKPEVKGNYPQLASLTDQELIAAFEEISKYLRNAYDNAILQKENKRKKIKIEPYQILKVPQNATDLEILGFPKGTLSDQVDEKQIRFAYQNLYLLWRPENALPRKPEVKGNYPQLASLTDQELVAAFEEISKYLRNAYDNAILQKEGKLKEAPVLPIGTKPTSKKEKESAADEQIKEDVKKNISIPFDVIDVASVVQTLPIPEKTVSLFKGATLKTPRFIKLPEQFKKGFALTGSFSFLNHDLKATVIIIKENNEREFSIILEKPQDLKFSELSPALAWMEKLPTLSGLLILSSFEYDYGDIFEVTKAEEDEPQKEIKVRPGLNFISEIELKGSLDKIDKALKRFKNYKEKFPEVVRLDLHKITFQAILQRNIKESSFRIMIPLQFSLNFTKLKNVPDFFKNLTISNLIVDIKSPSENDQELVSGLTAEVLLTIATQQEPIKFTSKLSFFEKGFSLAGTALVSGDKELGLKFISVTDDDGNNQYAIETTLPKAWKIGEIVPELGWLDKFPLLEGRFILSSFNYDDVNIATDFEIDVKKGLNFIAGVSLTGPLLELENILNKFERLKKSLSEVFIFKLDRIYFQGVLTENLQESSFKVRVPLQFGMDFTKKQTIPSFFKTLTIDSFSVEIKPPATAPARFDSLELGKKVPKAIGEPSITVQTDASLTVITQEKPITFSGKISAVSVQGFSMLGTIDFGGQKIKSKLLFVEPLGQKITGEKETRKDSLAAEKAQPIFSPLLKGPQYALGFEFPKDFKIWELFPQLKWLEKIPMVEGALILSSFDYNETELSGIGTSGVVRGIPVKQGLNVITSIQLAGPLDNIKNFIDKMSHYKEKLRNALIFELAEIRLQGILPQNLSKASFTIVVPLRLGVDFTKLKNPPKFLKTLTTSDLSVQLTAPSTAGVDPSIDVTAGAVLELTTQTDPLGFYGQVQTAPTITKFSLYSKNMLDLKWISLGELGMQIDVDYQMLPTVAALGIPFTGLGLRGKTSIGKQDPTIIDLAGYVSLQSQTPSAGVSTPVIQTAGGIPTAAVPFAAGEQAYQIPQSYNVVTNQVLAAATQEMQMMFAGNVERITLAKFIQLFTKIVKKEIDLSKVPSIALEKAAVSLVPVDMTVAGKFFKQGMSVEGQMDLFGIKGGLVFILDPAALYMRGEGWISNIYTPIFNLTNIDPNKSEKGERGASVKMTASPKLLDFIDFTLTGAIEIPPLKLKQTSDLKIKTNGIGGNFTARIGNLFDAQFQLDLAVLSLKDAKNKKAFSIANTLFTLELGFDFQQNFIDAIAEEMRKEIQKAQLNIGPMINDLDKKIKDAINELEKAKKTAKGKTGEEIERVKRRIKQISDEIGQLAQKCKAKKPIERPFSKSCLQIPLKEIERGGLLAYMEILVKTAQKIAVDVTALSQKFLTGIREKELENIQKVLVSLTKVIDIVSEAFISGLKFIQLKRAAGHISSQELIDGRLPQLSTLQVEINIPKLPKRTILLSGLQFDFTNPSESIRTISLALLKGISAIWQKNERKEPIPEIVMPEGITLEDVPDVFNEDLF